MDTVDDKMTMGSMGSALVNARRDKFISNVYEREGGLNPKEPTGDISYKGIRQNVYDDYATLHGLKQKSVKDLTAQESTKYYDDEVYSRIGGIQSDKLAEVMFDFVANSGPKVIKLLQKRVGAKADGIIGEKTLEKIDKYGEDRLADDLLDDRLNFIKGIKNKKFQSSKNGVLNRVKGMINYGND